MLTTSTFNEFKILPDIFIDMFKISLISSVLNEVKAKSVYAQKNNLGTTQGQWRLSFSSGGGDVQEEQFVNQRVSITFTKTKFSASCD